MPNSDHRNGMVVYKADTVAGELQFSGQANVKVITELLWNYRSCDPDAVSFISDVLMNLCSIIVSNITPLTVNSEERAGHASADIARRLQDVVRFVFSI